jgi:aminomethyltransferase
VRGGAPVFAREDDADPVGAVTSGAFGPSLGGPMAMGYVPNRLAAEGTRLFAEVRGRKLPVTVSAMPFVEPHYKRA